MERTSGVPPVIFESIWLLLKALFDTNECEIVHFVCVPFVQSKVKILKSKDWIEVTSGNTNASTIDFFEDVFTFTNKSVTVNCCHLNNTVELATCGLGASCAGSCSALGGSLCPSGNCSGDCRISFETNQAGTLRSTATRPSSDFRWCYPRCNVWKHRGCCYNPLCRGGKREEVCWRWNYLTGILKRSPPLLKIKFGSNHIQSNSGFREAIV